jgi:osmoprotectant transport system substrate-binding protein
MMAILPWQKRGHRTRALFGRGTQKVRSMHSRRFLTGAVAVSAVLLAGCGNSGSSATAGSSTPTTPSGGGVVRISGQNFTEAEIVADMYAGVLAKAGYQPQVKLVGTRDVYMATFPKSIDVVPEYVGGIVDFLLLKADPKAKIPTESDPQQVIDAAKSQLDSAGITLLNPSNATDTNAFFVTKKYSQDNNVTKLSDLQGKSVVLAAAPDCEGRLDCAGGLEDQYGINVTKVLPLGYASQQTYDSVQKGESQLGETSTTDGTLDKLGFVLLQDDKAIQPAQNLVPAISSSFLAAHPDVAGPLNQLMAALTTAKLTELNALVAVDRQKPQDVADQFLSDAGLS